MRLSRSTLTVAAGLVLALVVPFAATLLLTGSVAAVSKPEPAKQAAQPRMHRLVLPINSDDPTTMRALISTALNLPKYYQERNEPFEIEVVAYNAGVHMLRADTSPVKDLLRVVRGLTPGIRFVVCEATKLGMERAEGHPVVLLDNVDVVPNGPGRIIELQDAGWSYIRS
ncbi:DsrE family protein [Bradyrhizobium sp. 2S1]|uniref:DsrE family protein n=1 Tax=Bradyrhizobium sp. 2S1 TaxID=1404429 RepID=UPI00140C1C7E|nr:DsrE family protein [Bradyrhizobium sp. 2S1]MCK7673679.1 DsrE family protein [Bradyrhizobium sp. 2S1]